MSCFESEVWRQEHVKQARPHARWKGRNLCGSCSKIWAAKRMMSFSINVSTLSRFTAIFNFGIVSLPFMSRLLARITRWKTQFWLIKDRIVALNDQANQIQYIFCKQERFIHDVNYRFSVLFSHNLTFETEKSFLYSLQRKFERLKKRRHHQRQLILVIVEITLLFFLILVLQRKTSLS